MSNQTVPTALSQMGYAPHEIDQIVAYVNEHNTVVGAPGFKASTSRYSTWRSATGRFITWVT